MNGKWIEIFRGGRQTDSSGRTHNWTNEELDHAVNSFDPANHEPPVVAGHPASNKPAYGWIDALKREGNILLARLKQVEPAFSKLVEDGRFKKRSASFFPDGTLRHVGFLGAAAPAVKGLKDIQFKEEDIAWYEFEEEAAEPSHTPNTEEDSMTLEEALRENERLKGEVKTLTTEKSTLETEKADFAEKLKTAEKDVEDAKKALKDHQETAAKESEARSNKEIEDFVEGLVKAGKIKPADKAEKVASLSVVAKSQNYNFAEDGKDTFGEVKKAFEALPVQEELKSFQDIYPKGEEVGPTIDADEMLSKV